MEQCQADTVGPLSKALNPPGSGGGVAGGRGEDGVRVRVRGGGFSVL